MVTGILLTGMYNIGVSGNNKIMTPDGIKVDLKDVPFVRYRFENYGEAELEFIKNNKVKFPCIHIIDMTLNENTVDLIKKIDASIEKVAKFVFIDVDDRCAAHGLSEDILDLVRGLDEVSVDRISVRDKSNNLFGEILASMQKTIRRVTSLSEDSVGICGGPYCFGGDACLTAVRARELIAKYSDHPETEVVPSANHAGTIDGVDGESFTNNCGCIRYHIYSRDVEAPATKTAKVAKVPKEEKVKVPKEPKPEAEKKVKESKPKAKGYTSIEW